MNRTHAARSSRRSIPVYREVYQRIRSEILSGRLAAGARLPSSRTLAAELGIARGTVVTAFQMLAGEGYTSSAGARGTVVNVALPRVRKWRPTAELVETGEHHRTVRTPPTPPLSGWLAGPGRVPAQAMDANRRARSASARSRADGQSQPALWHGLRAAAARNCELFADCAGYHMFR